MTKRSNFLSIMVVGDNPEQLMEKYSKSLKVEPYVKFRYLDAEKMRRNSLKVLSEIINNPEKVMLNNFQIDYLKERYNAVKSMSSFEYYSTITNGLYYNKDGDAMTDENPVGKWDKYNIGKNFSYPLRLKDGKEVYQAIGKEIDWDSMNMNDDYVKLFTTIWDLVNNGKEPSTKEEENLKANWSTKKNYLSNFKTVDEFIIHNCAYWNYAFLDESGWIDLDDEENETVWINNFFNRFIKKIKDDDLVTIFEYYCNSDKTNPID